MPWGKAHCLSKLHPHKGPAEARALPLAGSLAPPAPSGAARQACWGDGDTAFLPALVIGCFASAQGNFDTFSALLSMAVAIKSCLS